jgi:hypothetical protein
VPFCCGALVHLLACRFVVVHWCICWRAVVVSDVAGCVCSLCGLWLRTARLGALHVQTATEIRTDINTTVQRTVSESAVYS